ncbi:uncharacterized protein RBU33_024798 isoform 1-T1 [Hipposideros larvatus]
MTALSGGTEGLPVGCSHDLPRQPRLRLMSEQSLSPSTWWRKNTHRCSISLPQFCFTLRQKPEQITFQHVCDHNIVLFNWFLSSRVRVWPSLLTSPTISLLSAPFSVDSTWLSCTPPTSSLFSSTSTPGHT